MALLEWFSSSGRNPLHYLTFPYLHICRRMAILPGMLEADPYQAWLDDFRREVDAQLAGKEAQPQPSTLQPEPAPAPPTEAAAPQPTEWIDPMDRLADENARLQEELKKLRLENAQLRERQTTIQNEISQFEERMARSREGYESHIHRLQEEKKIFEDQTKSLTQSQSFLQESHGRLEADNKRLAEELRMERERSALAERAQLELRHKLDEFQGVLAKLREELAGRNGALEELRRQASAQSERLIHSSETTASHVTMLRQDLKMFMEELRILSTAISRNNRGTPV